MSSIADPLAHMFKASILSGVFPDQTKIAKVVPLFKKETNFIPVITDQGSLLSTLSKILEILIFKRTMNFLNNHYVLRNSQFGFD